MEMRQEWVAKLERSSLERRIDGVLLEHSSVHSLTDCFSYVPFSL
jgi:hypothetical protein